MVVWLVLGRGRVGREADVPCAGAKADSGGGDGVDGGGVEAAEETVDADLTDGQVRRGRRGIGSLAAIAGLLFARYKAKQDT